MLRYWMTLACSLAALALVAVGCNESPTEIDEVLPGPLAPTRGAVVTQQSPITAFGGCIECAIDEGSATLTRDAAGLWLSGNSPDLVDGFAYTVWAAIFDNPSGCDGDCMADDFDNPSARATLSNFGGFVADDSGDFEVHLMRHDDTRQTLDGVGRSGVENPYRAEVHIILRSHGVAEEDPDDLEKQISEGPAFCNLPGIGCDNEGLSIFLPPGPPGQG